MSRKLRPWLGSALLAIGAAFDYAARADVLSGVMLFYPLTDPHWRPPALRRHQRNILAWAAILLVAAVLLVWRPGYVAYGGSTLLMAALPEEWFFRAYFMARMGSGWQANVIASLLFCAMHGLTWGWIAAVLVFIPSLCYGWLYQRSRDLVLLILVHGLSNLVFTMFLADRINAWLAFKAG